MKIALVYPPLLNRYVQMADEPLGLEYLAAVLAPHHDVSIVDAFARRLDVEETAAALVEAGPDLVGISLIMTGAYDSTLALCKALRTRLPAARIVLGGHTAMFLADRILAQGEVDAIAWGEGEATFQALIARYERGMAAHDVPGVMTWDGERVVRGPTRPNIEDLDRLPFPARHLLPGLDQYHLSVLTARGCAYGCPYCSVAAFWQGPATRRRSIDNALAEIAHLLDHYPRDTISIADDTFTLPPRRALEFCDRLSASGLELDWSCTGRVETIRPPLLDAMRRAGCTDIFFGIESGSAKVLRKLRRNYDAARVYEIYLMCIRADIRPRFSFIFGLPGEDHEAVEDTLRLIERLKGVSSGVHVLTPLPGTEIGMAPGKFGIRVLPHAEQNLDINSEVLIENGHLTRDEIREAYRRGIGYCFRAGRQRAALERIRGERPRETRAA